ncbi:MAG: metal-dependent hydrolase [Deltaproteobacteria bacterium]|nr:metal-dependent hydrolase [Deltaproteobacteria bacterium]
MAVGMLAGRILAQGAPGGGAAGINRVGAMVFFSGLALLPDVDYLGVMMGVPDSGPCGHRGATHSLIPPLIVALMAAALAPRMHLPRWRTATLCGLAVASHALLDAMTVTSRGVPLLWPISFARFEMPWRPIPNAPCGLAYLSREGMRVAVIEFFQFLPLLVWTLRPHQGSPTRRTVRAKRRGTKSNRTTRMTRHAAASVTFPRPRSV